MVRELKGLQMVTVTKVIMRMASLMGMAITTGHRAVSSRGTLRLVCAVGRVCGSEVQDSVISMRENGSMTRSRGMECLLGLMAVSIRVIT